MAFSFIPIERKNYAYEPVFQQHLEDGDQTISHLVLNNASETLFHNSFYFIKKVKVDVEGLFHITKRFCPEGFLSVNTYLRNPFYTYISIHAP